MSRRCPRCGTQFPDEVFFCGNDGTITIQDQDPNDHDPRLGTQLGGYILVARVADGAMGRVYEGRHPETKARVAVKVLHADVARDSVAVERFKREYETAAEFDHPYIVTVLEFGETPDGSWFLTMEYLEGEELGEALRRDGALSHARTVRILSQVALALDYAHSFGVIHRDLKPDNVFLCKSEAGDEVRLLDFGSVKLQMEMGPKLTAFGTTLGSPYYMSPEQAMGKQDVDQRTDVFAVAAILYEMLTGKIAFEGSTVAEILMKIVNESAPLPSQAAPRIPQGLDGVVDRGLRKDKTERFPSCAELATAAFAAFGLSGSVEQMAQTPEASLTSQLASAQPGPAAPLPAAGGFAPPGQRAAPAGGSPMMNAASAPAPAAAGSSSGLLIGLGVAFVGIVVIGGVVVAYLMMAS